MLYILYLEDAPFMTTVTVGSNQDYFHNLEQTGIAGYRVRRTHPSMKENKAGYIATEVACGWAGAIFEVTRRFVQEQ